MAIQRINESLGAGGLELLRMQAGRKACYFYQEEICLAPHACRFAQCKNCFRIDPRYAIKNFLEKVSSLARDMFDLSAPEPGQPPQA